MSRRIVKMSRPLGQRILRIIDNYVTIGETTRCQAPQSGGVSYAASNSFADVQAAVSAAEAEGYGNTVIIPAGSGAVSWGANAVTVVKDMTITGPGKSALTISGTGSQFFRYRPDATSLARNEKFKLGGFTLDGQYTDISSTYAIAFYHPIGATAELGSMILHDIDFYHCCRGIGIQGNFYGVAYNCSFTYRTTSMMIFLQALGNSVESWQNHALNWAYPFGTSKQFYLEDCTFNGQVWAEAGHGGRYAVRHCAFANMEGNQLWDWHGKQNHGQNIYGSMLCEAYDNTIDMGSHDHSLELVTWRGGPGLFYNNVVTGGSQARYSWLNEYVSELDSLVIWPMSPEHTQDPRPGYAWGNTGNGYLLPFSEAYDALEGTSPGDPTLGYMQRNVTYFDEWTGTYMGHAFPEPGVRKGLRSARPASMTSYNMAYWATDESKLYRWISPGTWELYYQPYTYPHPLRNA